MIAAEGVGEAVGVSVTVGEGFTVGVIVGGISDGVSVGMAVIVKVGGGTFVEVAAEATIGTRPSVAEGVVEGALSTHRSGTLTKANHPAR